MLSPEPQGTLSRFIGSGMIEALQCPGLAAVVGHPVQEVRRDEPFAVSSLEILSEVQLCSAIS